MKNWAIIFGVFWAMISGAAPVSQEVAVDRAVEWMAGNPVMSKASRSMGSVVLFPDAGGYSVYVVELSPRGYLILNSDDRLPRVVGFSAESVVDLSDVPENAFRAMLLGYCERMAEELEKPPAPKAMGEIVPLAITELYGPFLETSWNQSDPYNLLCPTVSGGLNGYNNRAPVGCVPTTFAQLLNYHRWPYHGTGSRSYTDSIGSVKGSHSADFSDAYDWWNLQSAHAPSDPQINKDAVAELMYELGVAAGVDYEATGTSGSSSTLGNRLGEFFFFEPIESHASQAELMAPMEAELRAGFPCLVSFPGHAFVADGLMVDDGVTTYHFNLGWGGANNGWWTKDAIPSSGGDKSLDSGITAIRPNLMAFPQTNALSGVMGESVEVPWILPKRRETEVDELVIHRLEQQAGTWQSDASEITGNNAGWEVVSAGRSGDCWFTGPNGPSSMVLDEVFIPDASAELTFWLDYLLADGTFSASVSTNGGQSFIDLFTKNSRGYKQWGEESVSLSAYAGKQVRLRFSLSQGSSYYPSGGVWLDDLAVTSGDWLDWHPFVVDDTLASRRFSAVTTPWDECDDFSVFEVYSTSSGKEWAVSNIVGVGNCFGITPDGHGGTVDSLTSYATVTPTASTRLALHAKYRLGSEQFSISVSTDRSTFTEIWSDSSTIDWGDVFIDLSAYAGQAVYVRLEYIPGSFNSESGIWVDSISTQEITNPELEGQPVYYTVLTNLPAGTHTLAAVLTDTSAETHGLAPSFVLTVDDGDGMPSVWEEQYGLDIGAADGGLDPDDDGYNNWEEYICGTIPTNALSCWKLEPSTGVLPRFYAVTERLYTIEHRTNLVSGIWETVILDLPGSNGVVEVDDYHSATNPAGFYRVEVRAE